MAWKDFKKNHLFPVLGGLAIVVLQALGAVLTPEGLTVGMRQLGFSVLSAVVGYLLTVSTRYWGSREAWGQPKAEADETVFEAR